MAEAYKSPTWNESGSITINPSREGFMLIAESNPALVAWMNMDSVHPYLIGDATEIAAGQKTLPGFDAYNSDTWYLLLQ